MNIFPDEFSRFYGVWTPSWLKKGGQNIAASIDVILCYNADRIVFSPGCGWRELGRESQSAVCGGGHPDPHSGAVQSACFNSDRIQRWSRGDKAARSLVDQQITLRITQSETHCVGRPSEMKINKNVGYNCSY